MICPAMPLTIREFFVAVYQPKRLRGCSPRTVEEYDSLFRTLERWRGSEPLVRDLSDEFVEQLLHWLLTRANRPVSAHTSNKYRAELLALWRFARRRKVREQLGPGNWPVDDPDVEPTPEPKRSPESWTIAELSALLTAAADEPGSISGTPAGVWWQAFLQTAYYTGYRIDTLLRLPRSAYDSGRATITASAEIMKDNAEDQKRLPALVCCLLDQLQPVESGLLFETPYKCRYPGRVVEWQRFRAKALTLRRQLKKIAKRAGVTSRRKWFHKLRATHATELRNAGGDATRSLGHSSPKVTEDSYYDPVNSRAPNAAELLPAPQVTPPPLKIVG